jgi:hypothetical protein
MNTGVVRKCVGADGKVSYTNTRCGSADQSHDLAVIDSTGLHPQRSYQEQLAEVEAQRPVASAAERQGPVIGRIAMPGMEEKSAECRSLDQEIASLSSAQRQLHDAYTGDRLTADRRRATDRRYALHCGQ